MNVEENKIAAFLPQQNFPNPFTASTTIHNFLKEKTKLRIILFDANGNEVAVLKEEIVYPGQYELIIDTNELHLAP